jgi:NADPH:quinone reductase-like Zn-dependent oxidoreductase
MGISKPRHSVLGSELAGEIVDKGPSVTQFNVGDPVFANSSHDCFGANAEFICIKESGCIARKPWDLSFEESAMLTFGGITALEFLRKAKLQAGEKILIYGASGSVGTSAVQLAKYFGAEVTAVCSNKNALLVKSLGADMVIDYHKENWFDLTDRFDVVFDVVGKAPEKNLSAAKARRTFSARRFNSGSCAKNANATHGYQETNLWRFVLKSIKNKLSLSGS